MTLTGTCISAGSIYGLTLKLHGAAAANTGGKAHRLAYVLVPVSLTGTEQIDRPRPEIARPFGRGHHDCGAAVAYQRTVEKMQRIAHHARVEDIVDRDWFTHPRGRIQRCVLAARHRDHGELLGGSAIRVLMGASDKCIKCGNRRPEGAFELRMAGGRHHLDRPVARQTRGPGYQPPRSTPCCTPRSRSRTPHDASSQAWCRRPPARLCSSAERSACTRRSFPRDRDTTRPTKRSGSSHRSGPWLCRRRRGRVSQS
jgi:hypothetical protein